MANLNKIKCYCASCDRETNHTVIHQEKERSNDEDFWWESTYSIVRCDGCDGLQFYKEDIDESDYAYDEYGEINPVPRRYTYPQRAMVVRPISGWGMPASIRSLYKETMDCLNSGNLQLAAAGFRAIIETICREENIKGQSLETMINNLSKSHIITAKDRDHLHAIRFMGNDSIHGIKTYGQTEVRIVAHIVNAVITSLYLIADEVEKLHLKPISKFSDFQDILDNAIDSRQPGEIDVLRNFIKHDRRIIRDDIAKFESELQKRIHDGSYKRLSLCPAPQQGRPQQYKIEPPAQINADQ